MSIVWLWQLQSEGPIDRSSSEWWCIQAHLRTAERWTCHAQAYFSYSEYGVEKVTWDPAASAQAT